MRTSWVHRVIKLLNFAILTWTATALGVSLEKRSITGPVFSQNFPDPSVIFADAYYAFSTTSAGLNVPVATSPDFNKWTYLSHDALPTIGAWTIANTIWAPDVVAVVRGCVFFSYSSQS